MPVDSVVVDSVRLVDTVAQVSSSAAEWAAVIELVAIAALCLVFLAVAFRN